MAAAEAGNGRPFVGRGEAVEALHRRFDDARAGTGGVTLLVGDTGVGKSTLVHDLVREMRSRGVRVLEGRAPALDAPPPFALIRSALESVHDAEGEVGGVFPPPVGGEGFLIGFAPRLDDGGLGPPVHVEERLLSALGEADDRPEVSRDSVAAGLAEQFSEFTRRGPTVLVLEDLHRSDEPSLAAIEYLAKSLTNRPLWILASVRPYAVLAPPARARLETFESTTSARKIVLRPLTSGEVADFLHRLEPGRTFTPEEIARRYSETGGNPMLLEQLDRRRRFPPPKGGAPSGDPGASAGPAGALDPESERTVAVAAVLGTEFPFSLLLRASGEDEETLAEVIDRLVGRGILLDRPGEELAFVDDRVKDATYASLTESRRRLLHRRAGEALEATGSADIETIYALARHFYFGKIDAKAVQYNRAAAEIAQRAFAPEVARQHLTRALESHRRYRPEDWDGETELVIELAGAIDHMGALQEAETLLREHIARPDLRARLSPHVLAFLELYIARIQTDRGEWRAAEETIRHVLPGPPLDDHPLLLARLHRLIGESLYYQGRYPDALAEHGEELAWARRAGNERATALGQVRRANVLAMMGQPEEALREAREAARTLERLGDAREASHARMFIGVVMAGSGPPGHLAEESLAEYAEAIRLAEKAHDLRRVGWALFNTGDTLRELGRLDEASEKNHRSREILERIGDRFGLVQSMIIEGKIALDRGEYDRAEAELLDAYRIVRELKAPADEVDVVLRLAQLSYARGDRASARRRVAELDRQNLPALRPDAAGDFERLKRALGSKDGADEEPPR